MYCGARFPVSHGASNAHWNWVASHKAQTLLAAAVLVKQGLCLTFGCSQWEERKMQLRERENKQIGVQSPGPEVRRFQRPCTWGLFLSSCGHLCIRFDCRVLAEFLCDVMDAIYWAGHTKVRSILGVCLSQCHAAISDLNRQGNLWCEEINCS